MGNILGKISDDEERYESLCKRYGEKPQEVYSDHHHWIEAKHKGQTKESFDVFSTRAEIKRKEGQIKVIEKEIQTLKFDLSLKWAEIANLQRKLEML